MTQRPLFLVDNLRTLQRFHSLDLCRRPQVINQRLRAREAVDAVLKSGKPLSPMISQKVINTAANHLDAEAISQVLVALKDRDDFSEAASVRLTRFRDLVLRRHKAK